MSRFIKTELKSDSELSDADLEVESKSIIRINGKIKSDSDSE